MSDPRTRRWAARGVVALLGLAACATSEDERKPSISVPGARREVLFIGMCDASGAVPLSADRFVVADDEANILRVYDANRGGGAVDAIDLTDQLGLPRELTKKGRPKAAPETDIEAATRSGDLAFWLTSHARSSSGKERPERQRFFATKLLPQGAPLVLEGTVYEGLIDALLADVRFARFHLRDAVERGPKEPGGFNIEGMTERPEGGVWVGFRNPIPDGKALLFTLANPERVVHGDRPIIGDPVLLDLGGLGVRSLSFWRGRYLIAAGHYDRGARSWLYAWDGKGAPSRLSRFDFSRFNPEGFFTPDERDEVLVLSDDGSVEIDGKDCKKLKDPERKQFRGVWLRP